MAGSSGVGSPPPRSGPSHGCPCRMRTAVGLLGACLLVAASRMLASEEALGVEGPKLTRLAVDRNAATRAPPAHRGTAPRRARTDHSFTIVTPTYPRDFAKNELFLATLTRNADGKITYHEYSTAESQALLDAAKAEEATGDA